MKRLLVVISFFISVFVHAQSYELRSGEVYKYTDTTTYHRLYPEDTLTSTDYIVALSEFIVLKVGGNGKEIKYGPCEKTRVDQLGDRLTFHKERNSPYPKYDVTERGAVNQECRITVSLVDCETGERIDVGSSRSKDIRFEVNNYGSEDMYVLLLYKDHDGWFDLSKVFDSAEKGFISFIGAHSYTNFGSVGHSIFIHDKVQYIVALASDMPFSNKQVKSILYEGDSYILNPKQGVIAYVLKY